MKKIKTIVALVLVLSMIAVIAVFKINAAGTPTFAFNSASVDAGDEVELVLTCSDNPGINGWAVNVAYDSSVMQIVKTDTASAFGEVTVSSNLTENPFRVQWFSLSDTTTNGKMVGITFKIDENAKTDDYTVSLSYDAEEVVNQKEESVHFDTIDATISVNGKSDPEPSHNLTKIDAKGSTCQEQGNNEYYYCEDCGKYFKDAEATVETTVDAEKLPLADHNYIEKVSEEYLKEAATCKSQAVYYKSCSVCGNQSTETFENGDLKDHDYSKEWSYDTNGHWHECQNCGDKHDEAAHISGGAATEEKAEVCTVCGYVIAPPIAHTHNLKLVEGKNATCTAEGQKAYYVCDGCGKWFEDGTASIEITDKNSIVISKKAHTPSAWIVDKEATEKEKGLQHKECTVCHVKLEEEDIPVITPQPATEPPTTEPPTTEPPETEQPSTPKTTDAGSTISEPISQTTNTTTGSNNGVVQTGAPSYALLALVVLVLGFAIAYFVYSRKHDR